MADQRANINAAGCLGRVLTAIGVIWIVIVALAGLGLLSESGWSGDFLAGLGPGLFPGLILLVAGRALSRRARSAGGEIGPLPQTNTPPTVPGNRRSPPTTEPAQSAPIPFEPAPPPPPRTPPPPRPVVGKSPEPAKESRADVVRSRDVLAQPDQPMPTPTPEPGKPKPKTSQELIDEARRRWGGGKRP